jgi:hypothetical protein
LRYGLVLLVVGCSTPTDPSVSGPFLAKGGSGSGPGNIATVTVTPGDADVVVGGALPLTATARNLNGGIVAATFTWSSGNPTVAIVSPSGVVTGVTAGGPVTIVATTGTGKKKVAGSAVVYVSVAGVQVAPAETELVIGASAILNAVAKKLDGTDVPALFTWSSSNPAIVSVAQNGVVTGVATGGPVQISATTGSGRMAKTGTATVWVNGLGKILFAEGNQSFWMVNRDGTGRQSVYPGPAMHGDLSYDGLWVVHSIPFVNELWRRRVDGSIAQQLTFSGVPDYVPVWSPDGARIAWVCGLLPKDVCIMNADGTGQRNLTATPGADENTPGWSPDGTRIVFASDRDGDHELYVMNADGTGSVSRLTYSPGWDDRPNWSPDGTKILFESRRDGGDWDLFVMNADGSNVVQLTSNSFDDYEPRLSPDGRWVLFTSTELGVHRLFTMKLDGTGRAILSTGTAAGVNAYSGAWR